MACAVVYARPTAGRNPEGTNFQHGAAKIGFQVRALFASQFAPRFKVDGVHAFLGEGGLHSGWRAVHARPPGDHLRAIEVVQTDGVLLTIVEDARIHADDGGALEKVQAGRGSEGLEEQATLNRVLDLIRAHLGE